MLSIEARIEKHAQHTPNKLAVVSAHGATTYQQLLQQATTQAQQYQGMQQQGVVLTATSDVEFLVSYFAVHMAGAVAVLLPATATPQQVHQMQNALQQFTFPEGSADVLFTTGTTGTPKGAVISTQAIAATAENIIHAQAYRPDITFIIPGQLNHLGCLSKVFATLAMGATCHLMPKLDLNELFAVSAQCKDMAAAAFLVPSCIRMLTHFGGKQMEGLANKMAFIETGGDALDAATMADIHALLPNTRLFNTYASTETGVVSTFEFTHEHMAGCVGKALPHTHFDITPEGHIRCWGRSLMSGYLRMGEQTTFEPLADGRFTTCDWGEIDEQGALHFKCRNSDIINTGGFKVSPQEVESVANSFPEVKACVCIAVPHPILGQALKLLVVPNNHMPIVPRDLARQLKAHLETHQVPLFYEQVEDLALTPNGKINRKWYANK